MEFQDLSLESLAIETLELSKYLSQKKLGQDITPAHDFDLSDHLYTNSPHFVDEKTDSYPEGAGLVFRIDKGISTFCLRGIPTNNIAETFKLLDQRDGELFHKLKIEGDDLIGVRYFESASVEQAEVIVNLLFNRRFPIDEDRICNISDPGFSWWMKKEDNSFQIFYNSISVDRASTLIKLGPIGDAKIAARFFMYLEGPLRELVQLTDFSSEQRSFRIEAKESSDVFTQLFELFNSGHDIFSSEIFDEVKRIPTLYFFLSEICALRKFWLSVEDDVGKDSNFVLQ
ncbi:MAG: hypothetical protein KAG61_01300 [Bacteriovoracaceae bacterium]|nr:hypothetical protein [Bacteriovoracaceae bacterium]